MRTMTLLIALSATFGCGSPAPRQTVSGEDTIAAFGHTKADTTGAGTNRRAAANIQNIDSVNELIRASKRGTVLPKPKRVERKSP